MLIVVCYDIAHDRRRYRLQKLLRGYGHRVQKSVFECHLEPRQVAELRRRALPLIRKAEDSVTYYRVCASCQALCHADGRAAVTQAADALVV
jgi:CRISPR-associated protein Cas2